MEKKRHKLRGNVNITIILHCVIKENWTDIEQIQS